MPRFVGRETELRLLGRELDLVRKGIGGNHPGRCVLLRGRRRVGKSRLAEVFVERAGAPSLFFTASRQGDREVHLFAEEVRGSDLPGADIFAETAPSTWDAGLRLLGQALPDDSVSIVVFDEFPYLVEDDRSIEATLQKQWDRILSRKPVLVLLIGSDIATMEALNTHGRALFQRGTEMAVPPLSPAETGEIVGAADAGDAFDAYLVTGGLPLICGEWPHGEPLWSYLAGAALAGGGQVLPPAPSSRPSWLSASRAGTAGPRACTLWVMGTRPVNINDVLDGHVSLSVDCIDRL